MKRRKFIKTVTASAATGFGLNLIGNSCSMNKNQPNILLIHTDQHRIECLGSYGNKDVQTPNIDSIANREFVFAHNWKGAGAMARSKNRKLLFHPTRKSLFFDLEKDPNELVDVYSITSKVFVFCAKEFYYPEQLTLTTKRLRRRLRQSKVEDKRIKDFFPSPSPQPLPAL